MKAKARGSLVRVVLSLGVTAMLMLSATGRASAGSTIYVRWNASGANNGSSWADAYTSLQEALGAAISGEEIWVAKGTYKPTTDTDRSKTFRLKTGVAIYGGFAGTEALREARDWSTNITILSGNIGALDLATDNSYTVVLAFGVNGTAILDGFKVLGGYNDASNGGGMVNNISSPTLNNLIFSGNTAQLGGGMYNNTTNPKLTNVTFSGNSALSGGGMYNDTTSNPELNGVSFIDNFATAVGGGMVNNQSSPTLNNVNFITNTAANNAGGFYNEGGSPTLTQVAFLGNSAQIGGAIHTVFSNMTMTNVTFGDNSASLYGGGIYSEEGSPKLTNVIFTGNSAGQKGGGIFNYSNGDPLLQKVTFNINQAAYGGGMYSSASSPELHQVTFNGNSAGQHGGGMYNDNASSPSLTHVTFSGNAASQGGAIYNNANSNMILYDSILWGDASSEMVNASATPQISNSIVQGGCPAGSTCIKVLNANPILGPLQANGGFTKTMALGAGSAAIDKGELDACNGSDERGVPLPQGGACDLGAYEVRALTFVSAAAYDGWILETTETSSLGGGLNGTAISLRVGDDPFNRQYRSLLSFNTALLPNASSIIAAKLRVRRASLAGINPFGTHGSLLADLAKPYFGGGLGLLALDFQAPASVSPAGLFSPTPANFWYTASLNGIGRANINKLGTTQFRLRFAIDDDNDGMADYVSFFSGDYLTTPAYRPKLIVYYNP